MKKRLPLIIVAGILITGLILGSFFDLQVAEFIYSERNIVGVISSAFGMLPGYGFISFISGGLFIIGIKTKNQKALKIILIILSFIGLGISTWLSGKDIFSINGFNIPGFGFTILATGIAFIIQGGFYFLGIILLKSNANPKMWIVLLILSGAIILALVSGTTLIKSLMSRPRYRTVQIGYEGLHFYNWWEPCLNKKELITRFGIPSEEFKSFPSGHSGTSIIAAFFLGSLPLFAPKLKKYQIILYILGIIYGFFIAFARMLVGAHYLSDVSFGAILVFAFMWIANEIIFKLKLIEEKE